MPGTFDFNVPLGEGAEALIYWLLNALDPLWDGLAGAGALDGSLRPFILFLGGGDVMGKGAARRRGLHKAVAVLATLSALLLAACGGGAGGTGAQDGNTADKGSSEIGYI